MSPPLLKGGIENPENGLRVGDGKFPVKTGGITKRGGGLKRGDLPYQDEVKGKKMKDETEMKIEKEKWCCWEIPFIPLVK